MANLCKKASVSPCKLYGIGRCFPGSVLGIPKLLSKKGVHSVLQTTSNLLVLPGNVLANLRGFLFTLCGTPAYSAVHCNAVHYIAVHSRQCSSYFWGLHPGGLPYYICDSEEPHPTRFFFFFFISNTDPPTDMPQTCSRVRPAHR